MLAPNTDARPPSLAEAYRLRSARKLALLGVLAVLLTLSIAVDIATGPSGLSVADTIAALLRRPDAGRRAMVIVWDLRLPAVTTAALVGIALSLAGAEMQTILDNRLASPFTLGVSSAASFGAALAIVLDIGLPGVPSTLILPLNAFACSFASVLLLQALARGRDLGADGIVMFGIALVFTFNALVALLQFWASSDALQQLVFWGMGSVARASWSGVLILAGVVAATFPFTLRAAWQLTALRLGEDRARSFGIDVGRLRFLALLRVSLLAATSVALVGTVGFVGLVGPHISRLLVGEDHRFFLPASALMGGLVLSLADMVSRSLFPGVVIPLGVVTTLVGLPVFFSLIVSRGRSR